MRDSKKVLASIVVSLTVTGLILASDPPDSTIHPVTGHVETVDSTWSGASWDIRHTTSSGGTTLATFVVASNAADDHGPRIHVSASGKITVVWWRDLASDQVRMRRFDPSGGGWGADTLLSASSENASAPELAASGTQLWTVYENHGPSSIDLQVGIITDEPDPIGTVVGSTTYSGDVDAKIHSEQGQLWVTWMHDGSTVGWSRRTSSGSWTAVSYQAVLNGDVVSARAEVRTAVLGS